MFFQILFSCNNISILGKPKGKEKQDNLEYDVSKATALWFYQDLQSHSPGGTACWVPAGGFNSTTPTIMGRLQSTIKTPLPSVLNFFHLSNKRASEIFKRRFKEKKKSTDFWFWQSSKLNRSRTTSDYKHTHRNVTWNTPKKLQQYRHLTIRWSFPQKKLFRKEEVSLYSGCFKIVPLFGKDIFTWDDPSNTSLGCLQDKLFCF